MKIERIQDAVTIMNCALQLERNIVGVKFLFTKEDFENADGKTIKNKMNYCVTTRLAMSGYSFKVTAENIKCIAGARALGLMDVDEYYTSGKRTLSLGIYNDLDTAKNISRNMTYCKHKVYGVLVQPLQNYLNQDPDVVIVASNPYNAMRIIQGYSYYYGTYSSFKMTGNQAICSECTAVPFETDNINISMLCIGTRHQAGFNDNELGIGIPFGKFFKVVQGVFNTINPMESNDKKKNIEEKLKNNNIKDGTIKYNSNYYLNIKS